MAEADGTHQLVRAERDVDQQHDRAPEGGETGSATGSGKAVEGQGEAVKEPVEGQRKAVKQAVEGQGRQCRTLPPPPPPRRTPAAPG